MNSDRNNNRYFQQALKTIKTYINDIEVDIKDFIYNSLVNNIIGDEVLANIMYIFEESDILPEMKEFLSYVKEEKGQDFLSGSIKYLYFRVEDLKDIYDE